MRTEDLFVFMEERHGIYTDRFVHAYPKPWTNDSILQNYRFCNVYRELDKETIWFADNWRTPNADDPDLWFASLVFRFINRSETAAELGYPVPWDPYHFKTTLQSRKHAGKKVYSGAYMISTHGVKEDKAEYLSKSLSKIWDRRDEFRYMRGMPLLSYHDELMKLFDVGSFIAGQVIADCKYAGHMKEAQDWWTFAASGPGSKRGLNRIGGRSINASWKEDVWRIYLLNLKSYIDPMIEKAKMPRIHAQDLQNCLCEWDKYERVRLGEGFPKQRYNGVSE